MTDTQTKLCYERHGPVPIPHLHAEVEESFCPRCGGVEEIESDVCAWSNIPAEIPIVRQGTLLHTIEECQLSVLRDIRRLLMPRDTDA